MSTATLEAVTVTTFDGETRTVELCPDGSWSCPFCSAANFPQGHEHHARYATWDGPCANPACIVGGNRTEQGTAAYRKQQEDRKRRNEQERRWKEEREQEAQAAADRADRQTAQLNITRATGEQLGFAWSCWKHEDNITGTDRSEYAAHMKTHGLKAPTAPKKIKLRKTGPAYRPAPLEVQPFKWMRWTEKHVLPKWCVCGHASDAHKYWHGNDGGEWKCSACDCVAELGQLGVYGADTRTAERRGQFWANGSAPHSVWVIPFEPLPWEATTRPGAPVLLYVGKPGRFFTDAYLAKYDRR